jgi:MFS family permease
MQDDAQQRPAGGFTETDVPARLDRLPWSRFHWRVIFALGAAWILDGLEVTLVGSLAAAIGGPHGLGLSEAQIGQTASAYLAGAVAGALVFGKLTDAFGRRRLFMATVGLYVAATLMTGLSWSFASFAVFRFLTGAGIGGEYSAVNSAVQELIPARRRGFTDLFINGSYWVGAAIGALGALVALNPHALPPAVGWRAAFVIGGVLGLAILFTRRLLPESPRWLMTHGCIDEAERIVAGVEAEIAASGGAITPEAAPKIRLRPGAQHRWSDVARTLLATYPRRTFVGLTLMASQAFCYNAIFFTYALILTRFYRVPGEAVGLFILPFALGNFLGPLVLGPLFDVIGRRVMIASTFGVAGVLLAITGWMFAQDLLSAVQQTAAWSVIFFFASAAASSGYLTVAESFPLEIRAVAIALFFAFGTAIGGIAGPWLFGALIAEGSRERIFFGYLVGAGAMLFAAMVEAALGWATERKPLEAVAPPLSQLGD